MGSTISVQTTLRDINNSIITSIDSSSTAVADANCIIKINSITIGETNNCNITFANKCSSSSSASIKSVVDSISKVLNKLTDKQREHAAAYFTTSIGVQTTKETLDNSIKTYLTNTCNSKAYIDNEIIIKDFYYQKCSASKSTDLTFINTGQATANCAIDIVIKTGLNAINKLSITQEIGTDWVALLKSFMWPIVIIIVSIIILLISTKVAKEFRYSADEIAYIKLAENNDFTARYKMLKNMKN